MSRALWSAIMVAAFVGVVTPAAAQGKGKGKHYVATSERAVSVTREVLVQQGYDVVRIERVGATQVVYYRRGNRGRGRGRGPLEKLIIRTVKDRVFFEDTPPGILVDIDVKLRL